MTNFDVWLEEQDRVYGMYDDDLAAEARRVYEEPWAHKLFGNPWEELPSYWNLLEQELRSRGLINVLEEIDPCLTEE